MISIINQPPVVCLSDNPAIIEVETDLTGVDNLHVIVQPGYVGADAEIGSDILYPQPESSAYCDLSEYIRSAFTPGIISSKFTWPDVGADCRLVFDQAKIYSIKIREGSGFPATYNDTTIQPLYVVPGQIPEWIRNRFYAQFSSYWNWIETVHPFLTLAPDNLLTTKQQTRKLYWMCWFLPEGIQDVDVKIEFNFSDFTTGSWTKNIISDDTLQQYGIYEIHSGYTALGIEDYVMSNYEGRTVMSYSVTLFSANTQVSEKRTYVIDSKQHEAERELAFRNSVGGYDTIMLTGEGETQREHNRSIVNVLMASNNSPSKRAINTSVDEKVKVNTGWLTSQERAYISELINSTEVFEITSDGLMPIVFEKQQIVTQKDNDTLQSIQLEYKTVANHYYENGI